MFLLETHVPSVSIVCLLSIGVHLTAFMHGIFLFKIIPRLMGCRLIESLSIDEYGNPFRHYLDLERFLNRAIGKSDSLQPRVYFGRSLHVVRLQSVIDTDKPVEMHKPLRFAT